MLGATLGGGDTASMAFPRCIKKEACFIGLMGDFWTGEVTTFQRLVSGPAGRLAVGLGKGSGARRVTLLLPCHARELGTGALAGVLSALRGRFLALVNAPRG